MVTRQSFTLALNIDLEREEPSLNTVKNDITGFKPRVHAPSTIKLRLRVLIVLRVTIKVSQFIHGTASRVLRHTRDINNAQTRGIVGHVGDTVDHVLVMVDGANGALILAGPLGLGEVRNVKDVRGGVGVLAGVVALHLVQFVIQKHIVEVGIYVPALVGVGALAVEAVVQRLGHDDWVLLVCHVVHGEGVFVEGEADLVVVELLVHAAVQDALGIVDVAVLAGAAEERGIRWLRDVEHDEAACGAAAGCVSAGADGEDGVGLLVGDDVVRAPESAVPRCEVFLDVKGLGGATDADKLLEVEHLKAVILGF